MGTSRCTIHKATTFAIGFNPSPLPKMKTDTEQKPVVIVARDPEGNEVARQTVKDEATAIQLMVARNRPLMREINFPKWAIETVI